jgi:hypothetical protein
MIKKVKTLHYRSGVDTNLSFGNRKFIKQIRGEPHCKAMFIKLRHIFYFKSN